MTYYLYANYINHYALVTENADIHKLANTLNAHSLVHSAKGLKYMITNFRPQYSKDKEKYISYDELRNMADKS